MFGIIYGCVLDLSIIQKKLTDDALDHFPIQLSYCVSTGSCVNLFVHSSVTNRQKLYDEKANVGTNSPFMVWKLYLDIIARTAFHHCDKYILPDLLSYLEDECLGCRKFSVCNKFICLNIKKAKVQEIVFETAFVKKLAEKSCMNVDPYFIIYVFDNYKLDVDYKNQYLTTERGKR